MSKHRVLIVEDEQDIAGLIKHAIERGGEADAQIVGSGDAALKAVTDRPPDLIILDLNLPIVSGMEVCRILPAGTDVPHVPIMAASGASSATPAGRSKRWSAWATGSSTDYPTLHPESAVEF